MDEGERPTSAPLAESAGDQPAAAPPRLVPGASAPAGRDPRPDLIETTQPLYHEQSGYRLRLDPADLARLRELPGSKGKSDRDLGSEFFAHHAARLADALIDDVPVSAEIRVVVDPYSRQAFLALDRVIRGIVSF